MGYKALDETNTGEAKVPLFAFTLSHFVTAPRSTGKGFPEPLRSLRFESMENNAVDRFLFTAHYFPTTENLYIHT